MGADYNPLTAFLEEAEETLVPSLVVTTPSSPVPKEKEDKSEKEKDKDKDSGHLLIVGCNDWESMGAPEPLGLDIPHLLKFKSPVANVFSSSTSAHFMLTLTNGKLYSCGNNLRGQLGLGDCQTRTYPTEVPLDKFFKCSKKSVNFKSSKTVVKKVATGSSHTLLLMSDGILYATGAANCGQIGTLGQSTGIPAEIEKFTKLCENIQDIACGAEHSLYCTSDGKLFSCGHPNYGVLGHGTKGEYIQKAGTISYDFVYSPELVDTFLTKDNKSKIISKYSSKEVHVTAVTAGKHHSACVLSLKNDDDDDDNDKASGSTHSRIYTWGFGGFGRLGHNCTDDELRPRELSFFSSLRYAVDQLNCGNTYTCAITQQRQFYFWGKLPNSPRGESQMYPKAQEELYDFNVHSIGAGSQFIAVAADDYCMGWGKPVGGKLGLEGDAISS